MIQKQTNHLLNEIKNSKDLENKIIGCSAIILTGLCYKIEKNYVDIGLNSSNGRALFKFLSHSKTKLLESYFFKISIPSLK